MNRRYRDQQTGLLLGDLLRAVADLTHRVEAGERRERELLARVDSLSGSVNLAWRKLEAIERTGRRPGVAESATAPLLVGAPLPARPATERKRIPLTAAARALGTSRKHTLRLAEDGLLDVVDLRVEGAPRAVWTVGAESVEQLLGARKGLAAPVDHPDTAVSGRRGE